MRNPWIFGQLIAAAVLLVISLIGIVGTLVFDLPELTFSFGGAIQAFAIFPGLVLSLVVNALVMRSHREAGVGTAEKVLLILEGVLIALLLLFHFYVDEAGNTFGLAILTWPIVILVAIVIACVAIFRAVS
ncbi:MAG TPA: hypothetical protein VF479_04775, partial [Pseudolysinimonas sp.]